MRRSLDRSEAKPFDPHRFPRAIMRVRALPDGKRVEIAISVAAVPRGAFAKLPGVTRHLLAPVAELER